MIACNACQLLATNLPVCHSCPLDAFCGLQDVIFLRVDGMLKRVFFLACFNILFHSYHDLLWRSTRCRLYCILQSIRGIGMFSSASIFVRIKPVHRLKIRLNLVGFRSMLASEVIMLPFESNMAALESILQTLRC